MANDEIKPLKTWMIWAALVIAVIIPFFMFEESVDRWVKALLAANEGNAPAIAFVLFAVLASDLFLPVPSCLLSALCGVFFGPYCGFAVSFAAMTASSFTGYFFGRFITSSARKMLGRRFSQIDGVASARSAFMLFVMRPVPVLAECSCVYAGIRRYQFAASALWMSLGNAVVSAVYASIGHFGRADDSFVPAFAAVIALSFFGWICGKVFFRKRTVALARE